MSALFNSLRFRLLLLVLLCTIPALALTLYSGLEQRRLAADGAKENAVRFTRLVASQHYRQFEGARQTLVTLSLLDRIRSQNPTECSNLLAKVGEQLTESLSIFVTRTDGTTICSTSSFTESDSFFNQPYFQSALATKNFITGSFEVDETSQTTIVPFAYPVLDQAGQPQLVMVARLSLDWINQMAQQIQLYEDSAILIVSKEGEVLARYPSQEEWIGRQLPNAPIIQAIIRQEGEGTTEVVGLDNVKRLFAFTTLSGVPGEETFVSVGIPSAIVYEEVNRNLVRNLGSLVLVALLAIILAWFSSDVFILQQVNALLQATRRLMAGELQTRAPVFSDNAELGQLAASFNQMAENLENRDQELRQAEAKYRTLIEQIPVITYTATLLGKNSMQFVSPQIEDLLGYLPDEWLDDPEMWSKRLHPDDRDRILQLVEDTRKANIPFNAEYRLIARNGSVIWVRDESLVIFDHSGDPAFVQGIMLNISERKQAEAELQNYAVQLERSNRELQDFAYIASHDLQEPLRKIQAFGERLEVRYDSVLDADGKDYLLRMRNSAKRLQNLINDLLAYSRVTTRGQSYQKVNLELLAYDVISDLAETIRDTQGHVQVSNLTVIDADPTQMRQLLQNLIGNALKFHQPGTPPIVNVSGFIASQNVHNTNNSYLQLIVQDNGIGFDHKYLNRIFQPFQRLHNRVEYEGSGIGLAICRKIVERHQGTITAESSPGEGSKFIVTLPLHQMEKVQGERV